MCGYTAIPKDGRTCGMCCLCILVFKKTQLTVISIQMLDRLSTMTAKTIVEYTAEHEGYRCGYCHSPNTKCSHGLCSAASICDIVSCS